MQLMRSETVAFVLLLCLSSTVSAQSVWHTDLASARREAERLNRPLLCHFGAKWCAPCQKMERAVFSQRAVIDQLKANAVCLKIDVDEHPELAHRFGVERFPTDVFLEPDGQRLMQSTGFQAPGEYVSMVNKAAQRYAMLVASREKRRQPPVSAKPDAGGNPAQLAKGGNAELMLEGYCPVSLQNQRTWKKGNPEIHAEYKGQLFQFVSTEARSAFLKSPEKYVPRFLGCDAVLIFTADRAVPGSIEWGAYYDDQLYLFTSEEHRRNFKESPDKYISTQVVLNADEIEYAIR